MMLCVVWWKCEVSMYLAAHTWIKVQCDTLQSVVGDRAGIFNKSTRGIIILYYAQHGQKDLSKDLKKNSTPTIISHTGLPNSTRLMRYNQESETIN